MPYKEYEDLEELRKVQVLSTRILGELDRVCRCLGIQYVVYGGTALGAVRHGGFIPWDDDVDVAMIRDDYERFLAEAPAVLSDGYTIVNMRNEPNFPSTYSYLALDGTLCIPEFYKDCAYRKPLSIDVFPLDCVPVDEGLYRKQSRRTWLWGRLVFLRATPTPYLTLGGWRRRLALAACFCAHWGMRILHVSPRWLQSKWEEAARAHESSDSGKYADYGDRDPLAWSAAYDEMYPALDVPFEDIAVKLPRSYDVLLARGYGGDYMDLPPLDKRKNHYPYLLDFGMYR